MTAHSTSSESDWLRNLVPHFLEQTKDRLAKIEAHRQAIHNGADTVAEMKVICDIAHKISGTADTFGYSDLGAFARTVEDVFLKELMRVDDSMVNWSRVEWSLSPLVQEIAKLLEPS